jgi:hypothetical protein
VGSDGPEDMLLPVQIVLFWIFAKNNIMWQNLSQQTFYYRWLEREYLTNVFQKKNHFHVKNEDKIFMEIVDLIAIYYNLVVQFFSI